MSRRVLRKLIPKVSKPLPTLRPKEVPREPKIDKKKDDNKGAFGAILFLGGAGFLIMTGISKFMGIASDVREIRERTTSTTYKSKRYY